jgi:hypothetical protein
LRQPGEYRLNKERGMDATGMNLYPKRIAMALDVTP